MTTQCDSLFEDNCRMKSKLSKTIHRFHEKILNLFISEKCSFIESMSAELDFLRFEIKSKLPQVANLFLLKQCKFRFDLMMVQKSSCLKKFNVLKGNCLRSSNFHTKPNADWFCNLTDKPVPDDVCWLLSLGKKFSTPLNDSEVPFFQFNCCRRVFVAIKFRD